METNREADALTYSRVRARVRHARWSMCESSSAHDHESPLLRVLLLSSALTFSANVGPRIFMVASQGLGFEEIRPTCNALLTPNPFLRPGEWESSLRGQVGKREGNFRAHFDNISGRLLMSLMLCRNKWTHNLENLEIS